MRADLRQPQKDVSGEERIKAGLREDILDLEQCLAGNPISKRWQQINIELVNKRGSLLARIEYDKKHGYPLPPAVPPVYSEKR